MDKGSGDAKSKVAYHQDGIAAHKIHRIAKSGCHQQGKNDEFLWAEFVSQHSAKQIARSCCQREKGNQYTSLGI